MRLSLCRITGIVRQSPKPFQPESLGTCSVLTQCVCLFGAGVTTPGKGMAAAEELNTAFSPVSGLNLALAHSLQR
jgi:hypothetical protein